MKYIRTKDEILSNSRPGIEDINCVLTDQRGWIKKCNVVKQSDRIVELCDYIFLFDNEVTIRKITHDEDELVIQWLKECVELGTEVKLAILTNKGLIYVAKMNKEGEPELLWIN